MKKKNLILFFPSKKPRNSAFEGLNEKMIIREQQMLEEISQEKVNIYMVRKKEHFFWKNEFIPDFQLHWDVWKKYIWEKHKFWDLVYGFRMPEWVSHTFPTKISEITKDKSLIEKLFPKYTLASIICNNYEEILNNFQKNTANLKVLKPLKWSLWTWIFIWEKIPDISEINEENFPYLLQEFVDTSWWFYEICEWIHDFRVIILDWKIIAKILRTPAKWSYISNTFQWWEIIDLHDFVLPNEILSIIQSVDDFCKKYKHRYYSIDMWRNKNGKIKIFELNGAVGYPNEYVARKFWEYTAKNILKVS